MSEFQTKVIAVGCPARKIFIERLWRSVKYEHIYLHVAEDGIQLYEGVRKYFTFYNHERSHQSLEYKTPADCYLQEKVA